MVGEILSISCRIVLNQKNVRFRQRRPHIGFVEESPTSLFFSTPTKHLVDLPVDAMGQNHTPPSSVGHRHLLYSISECIGSRICLMHCCRPVDIIIILGNWQGVLDKLVIGISTCGASMTLLKTFQTFLISCWVLLFPYSNPSQYWWHSYKDSTS